MKRPITPGPWMAVCAQMRFISGSDDPIFSDGIWHILPAWNAERLPIATVDYGDDHDEPTRLGAKDHAQLLACAPELLEALQYARRFLKAEDHDVDYVDQIIAKARGEA